MTLTIDFTPREEAWLAEEAARKGLAPAEIVRRLVDERLESVPPGGVPVEQIAGESTEPASPSVQNGSGSDAVKNVAAIALLNSWISEGLAATPEQAQGAAEELADLKRNLNANRLLAEERPLFP